MFLVDTSIFSYLYRKDPILKLYEAELTSKGGLYLSVQSVAELWLGANVAGWGEERRTRIGILLSRFAVLPIDGETALIYADLLAKARSFGKSLGVQDAWIMATAKQYDLGLISHDRDMLIGGEFGLTVVCRA